MVIISRHNQNGAKLAIHQVHYGLVLTIHDLKVAPTQNKTQDFKYETKGQKSQTFSFTESVKLNEAFVKYEVSRISGY